MNDAGHRAAKREADKLEKVLDRDPNFRKWRAWMDVIKEYEAAPASTTSDRKADAVTGGASEKPQSYSKQIVSAGVAYLKSIGKRAQSKEIAEALLKAGVQINGNDKIATVSAHLSNAKDLIDNRRGEGYGLREWNGVPPRAAFAENIDVDAKPH